MNPSEGVQNIDVAVTLHGGQSCHCTLPSNSPILHDLYVALASGQRPDPQQPAVVLQLPLDGGRTACSFMSTSVVSVTTQPPVLIDSGALQNPQSHNSPVSETPAFVQIDDFLTPQENRDLLEYALSSEPEFTGSTVTTNVDNYRKSRVLIDFKQSTWSKTILGRLKLHLPHIAATLNVSDANLDDYDIQLTASNDGDFFKAHPDSSHQKEVANRLLTYVYYLHRTPKAFSGGDLLLYDGEPGNGNFDRGSGVISVEPQNNSLIAFLSNRWHEVDLVRCPSGEFADSRFTVNGWLRRIES